MSINLSTIIIGKNSSKTLDICLSTCKKALEHTNKIKQYELIYVDSCSKDSSISIAKKYKCQIIEITKGFTSAALGRNLGKQQADFDYLLFLDSDMELYPDWLSYAIPYLIQYQAITGERHELIYHGNQLIKDIPKFNKITKIQPLRYPGGFLMIAKKIADSAYFHPLCRTEEEGDFYAQIKDKCTIMELPQPAFKHHNYKNIFDRFKHHLLPFHSIEYLYSLTNSIKKGYFKGFVKVQGRFIINIIASIIFYIGIFSFNPLWIVIWFLLLLTNGWHIIKGSIMISILFPYKLLMALIFYSNTYTSTIKINGIKTTIKH